jgi:tetratricopeptide (TPR) repeat protein
MPNEEYIFRALRQQILWPSIHSAIDVYQRRRSANADHYELIWRLIHICECTTITLAAAAITRIREIGSAPDYLKLRERCYGVTWNTTQGALDAGLGALDGSIDKWVEILQQVTTFSILGSNFLNALQTFLLGSLESSSSHQIDLAPFARAWSRACDVPLSVTSGRVSVREAIQAINIFRNRFAHVPFPYDQIQDIYRELEALVFEVFAVPPTAANEQSPLSGYFALRGSVLRGYGHSKTPENWTNPEQETFAWGKQGELETWDAKPFVFLDKMMRPYLLSRLKNEAGSWEYIRFLAEANAVYSLSDPELLRRLPRPEESDYEKHPEDGAQPPRSDQNQATQEAVASPGSQSEKVEVGTRDEAFAAIKERNFEPAIEFFKGEIRQHPNYHSAWARLGFSQREYGVDQSENDREKAEKLLRESIESFTRAANHSDQQYAAEAYYNRSKSHWRLGRLTGDQGHLKEAGQDADEAARRFYDNKFISWSEFLRENSQ